MIPIGTKIPFNFIVKKRTKMSKSRGNVVSIESVVHGVYSVADGYTFQDEEGVVVESFGVQRAADGYWKNGRPVFLHKAGDPIPCLLVDRIQHPNSPRWIKLLEKYG